MGRSKFHPIGLIHRSESEAFNGVTLFTTNSGDHANLINLDGEIVHRWYHSDGIFYAYLLDNGNLLCRTRPDSDHDLVKGIGGSSSGLVELDWESNVVWSYKNPMLHHDYERLKNGNTLVLVFDLLDEDTSRNIKGGYYSDEIGQKVLGDVVKEIDEDGSVVNQWRMSDILNFEEDIICPLESRKEWTHCNSLNITSTGDFLLSFRNTNTVGIVEKNSGDFLWKWGPGEIWHQHHPTFLANGNVLIFDNGSHSRSVDRSRVIEVNPNNNEICWEYTEQPAMAFYSYHISSAERQANGNTLICEGAFGRIFEVNPDKEVVWEYVNPFFLLNERRNEVSNMVFRAHKYPLDHPAIKGKNLDPNRYSDINRLIYSRDELISPLVVP